MPVAVGAATGMASTFGRSRLLPFGGCYGNALLVRGTIHDVEVVVLPGRPDGRRTERRTVLVARAVVDGVALSVGVCHLGLDHDEAKGQLAYAFDVLARRPGPRVLLGDWNLWRPEVEPIVAAAGFDLAPAGPTFPVGNPRKTIDHVAVDGFEVVGSQVVATPVSDHRALLVDLADL